MSASSGLISKGEKGKSKFQSLDINNLYKATENEPTQQKGTLLRTKNGMQSLGKVPTARRPPANLPSLKAENSGNEPAVSLVPTGAGGWGTKPGEGPPQPQQQNAPPVSTGNTAPQPAPVAVVTPVVMVPPPHEQVIHNLIPGPDKSWSAIMAREQGPNFLAHQSLQFQQEFPKLASEGGVGGQGKPGDAQYGPGPSLRPQTEGSWTSGGGRPQPGGPQGPTPPSLGPALHGPAILEPGTVRTNLAPHPAVGAAMGPAGPAGLPLGFPHGGAYRPLQAPFMMPTRPGAFQPPIACMRPRYPGPGFPPENRAPPARNAEGDEMVTRPIIRDEELNKMDEISRDPGWAAMDDIDYNQQLAFSDNEDDIDSNKKDGRKDKGEKSRSRDDEKEKCDPERRSEDRGGDKRSDWDRGRRRGFPQVSEDEHRKSREVDDDRRNVRDVEDDRRKSRDAEEEKQKSRDAEEERRKIREEVAAACLIARQRKEDEAKRFDESKRAERRDVRDWDERGNKRESNDRDSKRDDLRDQKRENEHPKVDGGKREPEHKYDRDLKRDNEHGKYEREQKRETDGGKYDREDKYDGDHSKYDRENKRDADHGKFDRDYRGRNDDRRDFRQGSRGPAYKQQLPPRLQAQAERMNSQRRSSNSPQPQTTAPSSNTFDSHWGQGRRYGSESNDDGRENRDRHTPDTYGDRYKNVPGGERYPDRHFPEADHRRHFDRKERDGETERVDKNYNKKSRDPDVTPRVKEDRKESSEEREIWRGSLRDERDEERRPQRPDSRDSRTSRDSRNSREDKHDNEHKVRVYSHQLKEEIRREELEKTVPRHVSTPPREADVEQKPARSPAIKEEVVGNSSTSEPTPVAKLDDVKEEKVEKSPGPEDFRQKGGKSTRGGRWGQTSSNTAAYTASRNGIRTERRRRTSGGNYNRPENESASSGEGGSELEKVEKDEKNRETRRSGGEGSARDGFAPSGQPSRRGRGAARGSRGGSSAPRRMDGYGPPPVKAAFPHSEPLPPAEEEEDRTKQKQAALNAGIAGGAARSANHNQRPAATSRVQRAQSSREPNRPKTNRGNRRPAGKGGAEGDDVWETFSNSDGDDRKNDGRSRRGPPRGPPAGAVRSGPNRGGPSAPLATKQTPNFENKEDKPANDVTKTKSSDPDNENENHSSNQHEARDGRGKKGGKDNYKGGKSDLNRGGGKDRSDRRPKPGNQNAPPSNQNTSGPQPLMSQVVNPPSMPTWRMPPHLRKHQEQNRQHGNEAHDESKLVPNMFTSKNESIPARENAWEKPLGPPSRSPADQGPSETSSQRSSPGGKLAASARSDPLLDDSAPPVNTIIFENTKLKIFPPTVKMPPRINKGADWKPNEELFSKAELTPEPLQDHNIKQTLYRTEQGMEMDLLNAELTEMSEENAADLKHRLAGTKTLWDQNEDEQPGAVFPATFLPCQDTSMDQSAFAKASDGGVVPDDCMMHQREIVFNPVAQPYGMSKHDPSNSSNVCKVKPQQQAVLSTGHSPLSHTGPLSPPPYSSTQQIQFNYPQSGMVGSPAFGNISTIPAVPSPPAGLYSTQPSAGLFMLDRSQYSNQYNPYLPLKGSSKLHHSSVYLSTGPLPPAAPLPSDMFSSLSQFRGQQPPVHPNPNTVLLTSTANTLMSASVKPSSQNIGVIGSKASSYQPTSNPMYFPMDAMQLGVNQSYLSGSGMTQRSAPVQQAAPNFYSNSPAPQTGFYNASNSGLGQPIPNMQQPYQGFVNQSNTHNLQNYLSPVQLDMSYRTAANPPCMKSGEIKEILTTALNSVAPKARPSKIVNQPPLQHSPTQQSGNKFGNYPNSAQQLFQAPQQTGSQQRAPQGTQSNVGLQGNRSVLRYPNPIQRPMAYRGRPGPQQQRPGSKAYYDGPDGKLEETGDLGKADDAPQLNCEAKLADPAQPGKSDVVEDESSTAKE